MKLSALAPPARDEVTPQLPNIFAVERAAAAVADSERLESEIAKYRRRARLRALLIFSAVWLACGAYVGANLLRGWIPHDDGTLAQSAQRVMHGQLPHRDYIELYTGGLSYWNALAFHAFGVNLASLRWMMLLVFFAWVPAVYFVARELVSDWPAAALTALAVAWSLPNYPAAMPSWYNLFFATFGVAALFAYIRRPASAWLFVAGVCGGLSFLVKSVGLYFIAATLLFFLYRGQDRSVEAAAAETSPAKTGASNHLKSSRAYSVFVVAALLGFLAVLILLLKNRFGVPEFLHYFLPTAAVAALLIASQFPLRWDRDSSGKRFAALFGMIAPFLLGVLAPVLLFLFPYLKSGAVAEFFSGVFTLPFKRVLGQFMRPTGTATLLPAAILGILVGLAFRAGHRVRSGITFCVSAVLAVTFFESMRRPFAYAIGWNLLQSSIPLLAVTGAAALYVVRQNRIRGTENSQEKARRRQHQQRVMLLLSTTVLCSLVQFPFAAPIYFCYVAPLVLLLAGAIVSLFPRPPRLLLCSAGAFALLFAVVITRSGGIYSLGWRYSPDRQIARMALPRAGALRVTPETAALYSELIPFVRERAQGHAILAGPDCPEVYFLSGIENPTPSLFEMFEDQKGYEARLRGLLGEKSIRVVVLNRGAQVSFAFLQPLESVARKKLPLSQSFGAFEVRWQP